MDFNWQLTILKERGLILENEEEALNFLHSSVQTNYIINYAVLHIWNALQQKMEISQIVCWLSWIIIMGYHHVQWDFHKNGKPNLYGVCNKTLRNYFFVGLRLLKSCTLKSKGKNIRTDNFLRLSMNETTDQSFQTFFLQVKKEEW